MRRHTPLCIRTQDLYVGMYAGSGGMRHLRRFSRAEWQVDRLHIAAKSPMSFLGPRTLL